MRLLALFCLLIGVLAPLMMRGTQVNRDAFGAVFAVVALLAARSQAEGMRKEVIREGRIISSFALLLLVLLGVDFVRAYQRQKEEKLTGASVAQTNASTNAAQLWLYKPEPAGK